MKPHPAAVIFDCNVLLQAMISDRGPAYGCKCLVDQGVARLYISDVVIGELRTLPYHAALKRFKALTPERVDRFILELSVRAVHIQNIPAVFVYDRDPDDAHYVNLALAAGSKCIVSRDRDLLDLMDVSAIQGQEFRRRFPDLRIMNPVEFLRSVDSKVF